MDELLNFNQFWRINKYMSPKPWCLLIKNQRGVSLNERTGFICTDGKQFYYSYHEKRFCHLKYKENLSVQKTGMTAK